MNEKLAVIGSAIAAFVASLCCLGPVLLGGISLGVALSATFEPLRPYFLGLTGLLLALGFYLAYRKPQAAEVCETGTCAPHASGLRKFAKPFLWIASVTVLALALFPLYGARLVASMKHPRAFTVPVNQAGLVHATLKVRGMTCEMCSLSVKTALLKVPGVAEAHVDLAGAVAHVRYDPGKVKSEQLVEAVNSTGFKASI